MGHPLFYHIGKKKIPPIFYENPSDIYACSKERIRPNALSRYNPLIPTSA